MHLGEWAYDDLLIYISELCKNITQLEINSTQVTDSSITQVLKKQENLKMLDISGCPSFLGLSFSDALEHWGAFNLKRIVLGSEFTNNYLMKVSKDKLLKQVPLMVVELNAKKKYEI